MISAMKWKESSETMWINLMLALSLILALITFLLRITHG